MKFKKKISILIISMIAVLFLLPLLFLNFAKPHEGMGLMMILFFIVNPSTTAIINSMIGKDIKNYGVYQYCLV